MTESAPYPAPRLRDMAVHERPQERLQRLGTNALSDAELLAMLLRTGGRHGDVLSLAWQLISEAGSLGDLLAWSEADFRRLKGIGPVKALQLTVVMEVARRVLARPENAPVLDTPESVYTFLRPNLASLEVEKIWALLLNRKNRLIKMSEVTSGTATSSLVHPREVFREAIRVSATAVVCVHNHPSGDPEPSHSDLAATRQLRDAAKVVGIDFIDHIIIGRPEADPTGLGYFSFVSAGLL